jgi:G3E family GTPase
LCCAVREDLAQTLRSLIERRDAGEIRGFRRIVIETSGLADPAPVLFTLGADPMLDQRLVLGRVVTLVDAVTGAATLERFAEASRQAAVADALVISKTDLAPFSDPLAARLAALNPGAELILGAAAADPATVLFAASASPHPHPPPPAGEGATGALKHPPLPAGEGGARGEAVGG